MSDDPRAFATDSEDEDRCAHRDPQGRPSDPGAYLAGDLEPAQRAWFEAHLVACEQCWAQVRDARRGRALAEALRETAPQSLRETVRALAAAADPAAEGATPEVAAGARPRRSRGSRIRRRAWGRTLIAGAATIALLGIAVGATSVLSSGSDPDPHEQVLHAAVAVYANAIEVAAPSRPPVTRIGPLALHTTGTATLAGHAVTVFRYGGPAGDQVVLIRSPQPFPRAHTAHDVPGGSGWLGDVAGTAVYCRDGIGSSWLVIAPTTELALSAGRAAGLLPAEPESAPVRHS